MRYRIRLLVVTVLGLLVATAVPAAAADELGISPDGVTWASSLPGPLFDPALRWVPGDSETRSFWVRNQSTDDGVLTITMLTGPVESLIDTGDLTVSAKVDDGDYTSASTSGPRRLVNQVSVAPGEEREVTVKVDVDPESPNASQDLKLDLDFRVSLTQDTTAVQPPSNGGGGNGGVAGPGDDLPDTGTVVTPVMLLLAALLVASGIGFVGFARRRTTRLEERPSDVQA